MQQYLQIFNFSKIKRRVGFSRSAPPNQFIFYSSFSLLLIENHFEKKTISQKVVFMFCLLHFSLKCIIKNNYLCCYVPLEGTQSPV